MQPNGELADDFRQTGIARIEGAFSADEAAAMREAFWRFLHQHSEVRRDDARTWPAGRGATGFKRLRRSGVFRPFYDNAPVRHALDVIFADTGWIPPKPGSQILLTFPTPGPWILPQGGWHVDCGFDRPSWPVHTVKLFAFFDTVEAEGGGTLLLSGSHRLIDRVRAAGAADTSGNTHTWRSVMTQHPALAELYRGGTAESPRRELLHHPYDIDGARIEPLELTGRPGDVVITHLHTFHCIAPNTSTRPRLMLGKPVSATESPVGPTSA